VNGLVNPARALAEGCRGQQPQRACQHRGFIGEDVAEHVFGHEHVEVARPVDEMHGGRIHQHVLEAYAGELARDEPLRDVAPQTRGLQHVGLVDGGQPSAPRLRQPRGHAHDALDLRDFVDTHVARTARVAVLVAKINPAGQLADEDEIHVPHHVGLESGGVHERRVNDDRSQVRVDTEFLAQPQQACLRPQRRIRRRPLRAADCAQQHRVRRAAGTERALGQGIRVGVDGRAPERQVKKLKLVVEESRDGRKAAPAFGGDLGPDAVPGQHGNAGFHARAS